MILALDIGNSHIYGGLFDNNNTNQLTFRYNSKQGASDDETGIFLRSVLRENNIDYKNVTKIALCSVVPDVVPGLRMACKKYFDTTPFILQVGVKTGLRVKYINPSEVGTDRIANSIAAVNLYPQKNIIIIDSGSATTFCAINKNRDYLGGAIIPGPRLMMESLSQKTAQLMSVEIIPTSQVLGRSTADSIQSGLYYGNIGMIKEIVARLKHECFSDEPPIIIGTGGFSNLFEKEQIFDIVIPELVLKGLLIAQKMNQ